MKKRYVKVVVHIEGRKHVVYLLENTAAKDHHDWIRGEESLMGYNSNPYWNPFSKIIEFSAALGPVSISEFPMDFLKTGT